MGPAPIRAKSCLGLRADFKIKDLVFSNGIYFDVTFCTVQLLQVGNTEATTIATILIIGTIFGLILLFRLFS